METLQAPQHAGKSIGTDATMELLNAASAALVQLTEGASAKAPQQAPCPLYQLACDLVVERQRIAAIIDRLHLPNDRKRRLSAEVDGALCAAISELESTSIDFRLAWMAGMLGQVEAAKPQPRTEAPDTSGEQATEAPFQPREEPLQVALPGVPQLLPAHVINWGTPDWKGGRNLLEVIVSPEQFRQLNIAIVRAGEDEREQLKKAGYAIG